MCHNPVLLHGLHIGTSATASGKGGSPLGAVSSAAECSMYCSYIVYTYISILSIHLHIVYVYDYVYVYVLRIVP